MEEQERAKPEEGKFKPAVPDLEVPSKPEVKQGNVEPQYDLQASEKEKLVDLLIDRKKEPKPTPYGVYVVENGDPASNLGRSVELEVFGEFFQNDEELMHREYGPYEEASTFIIVIDEQNRKPAGVMRLIRNSENGLKSLNDVAQPPWNKSLETIFVEDDISLDALDSTWDIATLAVRGEYRGKTAVSASLYHALYLASEKRQVKEWVAILDDKVLGLLEMLGIFFERYKGVGSANYLDSPASTPVYGNKDKIVDRMRENSPDAYNYLVEGAGLESEIDFQTVE